MPASPKDDGPDFGSEKTFAEESMSTKELAARIRDLETTLATTRAGIPLSLIPEHGAGPGMEVAETWSAADQAAARAADDSGTGIGQLPGSKP